MFVITNPFQQMNTMAEAVETTEAEEDLMQEEFSNSRTQETNTMVETVVATEVEEDSISVEPRTSRTIKETAGRSSRARLLINSRSTAPLTRTTKSSTHT